MSTARMKKFYIEQSSMIVSADAGLMATYDNLRYFPIDGMICQAAASDIEEIDLIKPYQTSQNGLCTYYTLAQPIAEYADANTGTAGEAPVTDSCTGYDELEDDNEDVNNFISDIEHSAKGCLIFLLASGIIAGIAIFIALKAIV